MAKRATFRMKYSSEDARQNWSKVAAITVEASSLEPDLTLTRNNARDYAETTTYAFPRKRNKVPRNYVHLYRTKPVSKDKGMFLTAPMCKRRTPSFHSRRNTQERGNTNTTNKENTTDDPSSCVVSVDVKLKLGDTAACSYS